MTEWFEQGLMPQEVQRLAGHARIETIMTYYVGILELMIDGARLASVAALGEDLVAGPPNGHFGHKKSGTRQYTNA